MLSTNKEIEDALAEKNVRDMTKSQLVKGAFRMLTLKLGQAEIPMIVTNHTYDVIGAYVPTKEMGGGSGLKYSASTIIYLSKKKEKDGKDIVGNIIKAKTAKSRLQGEPTGWIRLFYDERGLDRYYGLLELGEQVVCGRTLLVAMRSTARNSMLSRSLLILRPTSLRKSWRTGRNRSRHILLRRLI